MCTTCPRAWPGASAPSCWVRARRGPPRPGGSPSATDRRTRGPESPSAAPGVAISARCRSPEGAARLGRLPEGASGGSGVRRARHGWGCAGWARGPVLGSAAGFGCRVPDSVLFGTSFVSAAALGPASSPPSARGRCAGGIY